MCALGNVFDVTVLLRDTEANQHTRTHARTEHTHSKQHTAGSCGERASESSRPCATGGVVFHVCCSVAEGVNRVCVCVCLLLYMRWYYVENKVLHVYVPNKRHHPCERSTLTLASPASPRTQRT